MCTFSNILENLEVISDLKLLLVVNGFGQDFLKNLRNDSFHIIYLPLPSILIEQIFLPIMLILYRPRFYINGGNTASLFTFGVKFILLIHDISYTKPPSLVPVANSLRRKVGKFYRKFTVSSTIKRCSHIITVSAFACKDIQKSFEIEPEKISIVPNGISKDFLNANKNKDNVSSEKNIIFITGTDDQKNMNRCLAALKSVILKKDLHCECNYWNRQRRV